MCINEYDDVKDFDVCGFIKKYKNLNMRTRHFSVNEKLNLFIH